MSPAENPEQIENDIQRTRAEMTDTIQAIERKLSPKTLMDNAMDTMRTSNMSAGRMADLVKENPFPMAMVGLGLGWLVINSLRGSQSSSQMEDYGHDYGETDYELQSAAATEGAYGSVYTEETAGYGAGAYTSEASGYEGYASARGRAGYGGDGGGRMQSTSRDYASRARETMSDYGEQAREGTRRVGERMSGMTRRMRDRASRMASQSGGMYRQHPLAGGMMALAIGAALGAMLPASRTERRMAREMHLRETGEEMWERTKEAAGHTAEVAREQAAEAVRKTKDAAKAEVNRQTGGEAGSGATSPGGASGTSSTSMH